jgi:hypothetical protein
MTAKARKASYDGLHEFLRCRKFVLQGQKYLENTQHEHVTPGARRARGTVRRSEISSELLLLGSRKRSTAPPVELVSRFGFRRREEVTLRRFSRCRVGSET